MVRTMPNKISLYLKVDDYMQVTTHAGLTDKGHQRDSTQQVDIAIETS